ncbi:MAG: hypothetical protein ABI047_16485 [Jatrophihabitantaceae bacterium]
MKSEWEVAPAGDGQASEPATPEPLIGVGSWPGAVSSYRIDGTEQAPTLTVTLSARAELGVSGPLDSPGTAAEQAEHYRLICSQLDQPGLTVSLLSTLNPSLVMPVADGPASLRSYAAAAELLAGAQAGLTPPDLTSTGTLDELLDGYGVPAQRLAATNTGRPLQGLLAAGQPLAARTGQIEPDTVPSDASTLVEVADRLRITPERLLEDNRGLRLAVQPSWALPGVMALPADAALSRPLAVLAGDGPLTAAEVQAQHGCPPAAFAAANAAVLGVLQPGVQLSVDALTVTIARHDTLNAVLSRCAAAGVPLSAAELLAANASTPLFQAGARVLLPPPPVTLGASGQLVGTFAAPAFELVVTLRLERPGLARPAAADSDGTPASEPDADPDPAPEPDADPDRAPDPAPAPAERVDSVVPAQTRSQDGAAFVAFVDACLVAVPSIRLATARLDTKSNAVWAVAFDSQGIASVRLQPPAGYTDARFLAPRPLYADPLSFQAPVSELTALGTLGKPAQQAFSDIDIDAERWARRFLTDLDHYLDQPFATLLADKAPDALLAVRRELAEAIAAGAAPVLEPDPAPGQAGQPAGLPNARAALAAAGRTSSAGGYGSVAVQHVVAAVTRFGTDQAPAAQLGGVVRVNGAPQPSTTDLGQPDGWSTFVLDTSRQDTSEHGGATSVSLGCDHAFDSLTIGSPTAAGGDRVELSFVRPLTGAYLPKDVRADLGAVELPLVQRLRPGPPTLLAVQAQPSWTGPGQPTPGQAAHWTLAVSYSHDHAAHDEVTLSIWHAGLPAAASADDQPGGLAQAGTEPSMALAIALASYLAVADQLAALLGWYTKAPKGADPATARRVRENAVATLAELAGAVAHAWAGHHRSPAAASVRAADPEPADPAGDQRHDYRLRAGYSWTADGTRQLERLIVTADHVSADQPGADWPVISWEGGGEQEPLTPGATVNGQRSYTPTRPVAASQPLTFRLQWPGLGVLSQQRAWTGIGVIRNSVLRAGARTSPDFVLTSPTLLGAEVSPANTWPEPIALSGASVAQALQTCFDALFGPRPGDVRLGLDVRYSYLLGSPAAGGPELRAALPVASTPAVPLSPELAGNLAREVEDWRQHVGPPASGAEWHFRLALLSPRPGEPPPLVFDQLVFTIAA